jgi:hypothetical protein
MRTKFEKLLLIFIISFGFISIAFGQRQKPSASVLLDKNKPAVYVSFLNIREITPDDPTDETKYLFFEIKNNTQGQGKISLQMSGVSKKERGDASLYFAIEDSKKGTVRIGSTQCHVCSVNPVGPGRSLIFSVPFSYASKDDLMKIAYSFDWERNNDWLNDSHSSHYVEFYFEHMLKTISSAESDANK